VKTRGTSIRRIFACSQEDAQTEDVFQGEPPRKKGTAHGSTEEVLGTCSPVDACADDANTFAEELWGNEGEIRNGNCGRQLAGI